jgi:hypothetical protein
LSACGNDSVQNDGVPTISDYENIVVDGKPMKHDEFFDKYCVGKSNNETCLRVMHAGEKAKINAPYSVDW